MWNTYMCHTYIRIHIHMSHLRDVHPKVTHMWYTYIRHKYVIYIQKSTHRHKCDIHTYIPRTWKYIHMSHIHTRTHPLSTHKAAHTHIHSVNRALHSVKRAEHSFKRAIYSFKNPRYAHTLSAHDTYVEYIHMSHIYTHTRPLSTHKAARDTYEWRALVKEYRALLKEYMALLKECMAFLVERTRGGTRHLWSGFGS